MKSWFNMFNKLKEKLSEISIIYNIQIVILLALLIMVFFALFY
jgi:hypothetical protein